MGIRPGHRNRSTVAGTTGEVVERRYEQKSLLDIPNTPLDDYLAGHNLSQEFAIHAQEALDEFRHRDEEIATDYILQDEVIEKFFEQQGTQVAESLEGDYIAELIGDGMSADDALQTTLAVDFNELVAASQDNFTDALWDAAQTNEVGYFRTREGYEKAKTSALTELGLAPQPPQPLIEMNPEWVADQLRQLRVVAAGGDIDPKLVLPTPQFAIASLHLLPELVAGADKATLSNLRELYAVALFDELIDADGSWFSGLMNSSHSTVGGSYRALYRLRGLGFQHEKLGHEVPQLEKQLRKANKFTRPSIQNRLDEAREESLRINNEIAATEAIFDKPEAQDERKLVEQVSGAYATATDALRTGINGYLDGVGSYDDLAKAGRNWLATVEVIKDRMLEK